MLTALMPPNLLQVPEPQYPAVSGLTHRAATGVDNAAQPASAAAKDAQNMDAGNARFLIIASLGRPAWNDVRS